MSLRDFIDDLAYERVEEVATRTTDRLATVIVGEGRADRIGSLVSNRLESLHIAYIISVCLRYLFAFVVLLILADSAIKDATMAPGRSATPVATQILAVAVLLCLQLLVIGLMVALVMRGGLNTFTVALLVPASVFA